MKIRVLVVDDDEDLLFLASKFLEKEDKRFELISANTDQEALQKIEEEEFDAIVCDHYLGPHSMTGLDLLEWVREAHPNIPFIIFTGRSQEAVAIRALNLGAAFYLKKGTDEIRELFGQIAHRIIEEVDQRRSDEALESAYSELERRVSERTAELEDLNSRLLSEIDERQKIEQSLLLQQDLGNALCKSNNITEALDIILKTVVQLEGVDSAGIYLIDSETGNIDLSNSQGLSTHVLTQILKEREGKPFFEPVFLSIEDIGSVSNSEGNLKSAAVIPILFNNEAVAILSLVSHTHEKIHERDQRTLQAIAMQISAYMARIYSEKSIRDSKSDISTLSNLLYDLLLVLNSNFEIVYFNNVAQDSLGETSESILSRKIQDFIKPEEIKLLKIKLKEALEGTPTTLIVHFSKKEKKQAKYSAKIAKGKYEGHDVLYLIAHEI